MTEYRAGSSASLRDLLGRASELLNSGLVALAGLGVLCLMVHVVVNAVSRTLFNHPIGNTIEYVANYWMIIATFLAVGYAEFRREHIRATVLRDQLGAQGQKAADALACIAMLALALLLVVYGWQEAVKSMRIRETAGTGAVISIWPLTFLVPIGGAALALQALTNLIGANPTRSSSEHGPTEAQQ